MSEMLASESKMDEIFQKVYRESLQDGGEVQMSYFGGFSTDLVSSFADKIENILKSKQVPKVITKRMFTVIVEGLQNICIHGEGVFPGKIYGHIMLVERENEYLLSIGNFVDTKRKKFLNRHLKRVNNMTNSELKEYYLEALSKGVLTEKNGAGLGIITIALKFNSKMKYQFKPYDNGLYYYNLNIVSQESLVNAE